MGAASVLDWTSLSSCSPEPLQYLNETGDLRVTRPLTVNSDAAAAICTLSFTNRCIMGSLNQSFKTSSSIFSDFFLLPVLDDLFSLLGVYTFLPLREAEESLKR